jgi:hypothetical protein
MNTVGEGLDTLGLVKPRRPIRGTTELLAV